MFGVPGLTLEALQGEVTEAALLGFNRPDIRALGVPGGGGISTAADLALYYQALLHNPGGLWDPAWLAAGTREVHGELPDPLTHVSSNRALGTVIAGEGRDAAMRGFGYTVSPRAFGHAGAGGQIAFADPDSDLSFCYLTNGLDANVIREHRRTASIASKMGALALVLIPPPARGSATSALANVGLQGSARGDSPSGACGRPPSRSRTGRRATANVDVVRIDVRRSERERVGGLVRGGKRPGRRLDVEIEAEAGPLDQLGGEEVVRPRVLRRVGEPARDHVGRRSETSRLDRRRRWLTRTRGWRTTGGRPSPRPAHPAPRLRCAARGRARSGRPRRPRPASWRSRSRLGARRPTRPSPARPGGPPCRPAPRRSNPRDGSNGRRTRTRRPPT